jgi:hypothetical protein
MKICAVPESADSMPREACPRELHIIDELCQLAIKLDNISKNVRGAILWNEIALDSHRKEFEAIRDEIIAKVQRLAVHRIAYHPQASISNPDFKMQ